MMTPEQYEQLELGDEVYHILDPADLGYITVITDDGILIDWDNHPPGICPYDDIKYINPTRIREPRGHKPPEPITDGNPF